MYNPRIDLAKRKLDKKIKLQEHSLFGALSKTLLKQFKRNKSTAVSKYDAVEDDKIFDIDEFVESRSTKGKLVFLNANMSKRNKWIYIGLATGIVLTVVGLGIFAAKSKK